MMRRLPPCPYLRRRVHGRARRAARDAVRDRARRLELAAQRRRASATRCSRPGWTDYRERIEYAAHDVTALLRDGENVLGAILGDGWYAGFVGFDARRPGNHYGAEPELLCELHLEHADGSARDRRLRRAAGGRRRGRSSTPTC